MAWWDPGTFPNAGDPQPLAASTAWEKYMPSFQEAQLLSQVPKTEMSIS